MNWVINNCEAQGFVQELEGLSKALGDAQVICSGNLLEALWEQKEGMHFFLFSFFSNYYLAVEVVKLSVSLKHCKQYFWSDLSSMSCQKIS